jgi:glutamine amidotransferase PdxT
MNKEDVKYIRIHIKWTDILLSLGACAGDLIIEKLNPLRGNHSETLMVGRIKIKRNSLGYENMVFNDIMTYDEFENFIRPTIDIMVRSYHAGMLLDKSSYTWIKNWKVKND